MPSTENKHSIPNVQFPLLPEEPQTPEKSPEPSLPNIDRFFPDPLPELADSTQFHQGSRPNGRGYSLVGWSFLAAAIDALILFGTSCLFLLSISWMVKVQLSSLSLFFSQNLFEMGLIFGAFLICTYMIMLRVFLGFTIGEWACGLRLGSLKQRLNRFYSLKVIARMTLILATGGLLLPLLSMALGRDVPGLIVGLPLVQRKP